MSETITLAKGLTLEYALTNTFPGTAVPQLIDANLPKMSFTNAEVTAYESANIERVPVFADPGTVNLTFNYTNALYTTFQNTLYGVLYYWKYTVADTHTVVFRGFVDDVDPVNPLKAQNQFKARIQVVTLLTLA